MGHRLSKIATRTGDDGTTGLGDGRRVTKDHIRIEVIGDIDELNSFIGLIISHPLPDDIRQCLIAVQHTLFDIGGELCLPDRHIMTTTQSEQLDKKLGELNESLPPLKEFILPGGNPATACCHLARAVCRRAERHLVTLDRRDSVNPHTLAYVNRLSDLLFVIARTLTHAASEEETQWLHKK